MKDRTRRGKAKRDDEKEKTVPEGTAKFREETRTEPGAWTAGSRPRL
jgi:hypothetical protein